MCNCSPEILNDDTARFGQMVVLDLPKWHCDYAWRMMKGYPPTVSVDPCIVEAIKQLWSLGIETTGCCCGHNRQRAIVNVHPRHYERMFELGYEQRPVERVNGAVMGLYTFYL